MKYALYGFDLNGTLIDTFEIDYGLDCKHAVAFGGRPPSREEFRRIIGQGNWQEYYAELGVKDWEKALDMFYQDDSRLKAEIKSIPRAKEVLTALASAQKHLFLVSVNDPESVSLFLRKSGLESFFDKENIYAVEESKTANIMEAYKKMGVNPRDTVFTGDTVKDVRCAKEAGVVSVGLANDLYSYSDCELLRREADYTISGLEELLGL
jgi:phosphoglycolate phosphatase-like HAD superfamily hydrolase